MAYLLELSLTCDGRGRQCKSSAKVTLKNHRNETIGQFCRPCGKTNLASLKRSEAPTD